MSAVAEALGILLMGAGLLFLCLAVLGLWRLPDTLSQLHALAKADTVGIALVALGAGLLIGTLSGAVTLLVIVGLIAMSGATAGHLIARVHLQPHTLTRRDDRDDRL